MSLEVKSRLNPSD